MRIEDVEVGQHVVVYQAGVGQGFRHKAIVERVDPDGQRVAIRVAWTPDRYIVPVDSIGPEEWE